MIIWPIFMMASITSELELSPSSLSWHPQGGGGGGTWLDLTSLIIENSNGVNLYVVVLVDSYGPGCAGGGSFGAFSGVDIATRCDCRAPVARCRSLPLMVSVHASILRAP